MQSSSPAISVVMPAYNASGYIEATIASILAQTVSDFELIVVNDCSKDNTAEIVTKFAETDSRVRLVTLQKNFGRPAGPRNLGVREAKADWIAFIDSDDIWHPAKLELQLKALAETGAQFCSTQMRDFKDGSYPVFPDVSDPEIEYIGFVKQAMKVRTPTSSVVARRDLLLRNPFNEDVRYKAREDMECWLHCHEDMGQSIKLQAPLVGYRVIPGQISGNKLEMVKRHHYAMRRYRYRSGRQMGILATFYTFSHFFLALIYRRTNRGL